MNEHDIVNDADGRMDKTIAAFKHELSKIRTGRAHTSLLEHITVKYYGSEVPLNQAGTIGVQDSRTLSITAWDKSVIPDIEKAILNSDLGLNPVTAGNVIHVPLPPLTEDRRKELIKVVRAEAEKAKVAIRNIRRDANQSFKSLMKDKGITEDQERRDEERIQKLTDKHTQDIDRILSEKEKELLEI
jgi:ribosome recycling factor